MNGADWPDATPAGRWMPLLLAMLVAMLCFTVTMLALSRPDYRRFAEVAGGLEFGFGHEGTLAAEPVPHGNAVVAQAFFPEGEPVPVDAAWNGSGQLPPLDLPPVAAAAGPAPGIPATVKADADALIARARVLAAALAGRFSAAIAGGEVEIEARGRRTILRLLEKGTFAPGSIQLDPARRKALEALAPLLTADGPSCVLRGHHAGAKPGEASDWALSAARAAAVAEALQAGDAALAPRLSVVAYGATRPPATPRAGARHASRVELTITQTLTPELAAALATLRISAPAPAAALDALLDSAPPEVP